ncbi:MAG: hypothetical protein QNJ53_20310, partial [Pleurocapsa sp. MO_192.B19]|nr:hypothetical protein [Pleurocapsa sp. MO_192.B19]
IFWRSQNKISPYWRSLIRNNHLLAIAKTVVLVTHKNYICAADGCGFEGFTAHIAAKISSTPSVRN